MEYFNSLDTIRFKRIDYISGINLKKYINNYLVIGAGFQDSRKRIIVGDEERRNFEERLVLSITLNFSKSSSFYIF